MYQKDVFDVTIIGGGPAGLYSAFYSGLREMKTKLIEFHSYLGGKVNVYPEKMIWDIGGQPPISGDNLIKQLVGQGMTFHPEIVLNEKIVSVSRLEDGIFRLQAASGNQHYSRTIILAVGGGILNPQKLPIEGAERFEVSNLNYTVKSMERFKDKTVIISGGGNSAIDWANELEPIAKQVYLTYRKEELSGHEAQISQLLKSSAICLNHTSITKLIADPRQEKIEKVELSHQITGERIHLSIDEVVINHGYEREAALLKDSEVDFALVDGWMVDGNAMSDTSVPGIYAAGDVLHHEGKVHLIAGAFQDAANAVNRAKRYIQPDADKTAMVSSHNELFKQRNKKLKKRIKEPVL